MAPHARRGDRTAASEPHFARNRGGRQGGHGWPATGRRARREQSRHENLAKVYQCTSSAADIDAGRVMG